ncbi:hypothetical protein B4135_1762 [Caldibacillus debilis]|uniref:Uncharacterized protein n=1 Tax=Caldibacillus debilis TaxID=301148 RepID=A0A150M9D4_9BACI|nr:hypothetical protein B4135_1762 [Caldibacillus debilis]
MEGKLKNRHTARRAIRMRRARHGKHVKHVQASEIRDGGCSK